MSDSAVKVDVPLAVLDDEADLLDGNSSCSAAAATVAEKFGFAAAEKSGVRGSNIRTGFGGKFCHPLTQPIQPSIDTTNNNPRRSNSFTASITTNMDTGDDENLSNNSSAELDTFAFAEASLTGSLENLVGHFDENISRCLKNFQEKTDSIAPVQIRTQEEIMSKSQIWMTLTGNYGDLLPLDWSQQNGHSIPLRLRSKESAESTDSCLDLPDDEELAHALDLQKLMSPRNSFDHHVTNVNCANADSNEKFIPPAQTADQVIEEIDEIMQQSCDSEFTASSDFTMDSIDSLHSPGVKPIFIFGGSNTNGQSSKLGPRVKSLVSFASSIDELKNLSVKKLISYRAELESLIQVYNETLVQELALRDELEYEKELKNRFISLMSSIQSKKRKYHLENKKRNKHSLFTSFHSSNNGSRRTVPQYLTTVVPYEVGGLTNFVLEALIKILYAINEDNPNVPNMLTDYILNVLCPSTAQPTTTAVEKSTKPVNA